MTLFTASGLLAHHFDQARGGMSSTGEVIHSACLRWLATQGGKPASGRAAPGGAGWLESHRELHAVRAPGMTVMAALQSGHAGSPDRPINDSKGCGGIMRIAPVGLARPGRPAEAFELGARVAALTHGHPSGYLAAGFQAALIALVVEGAELEEAIAVARSLLAARPGHEETTRAVDAARTCPASGPPTAETLERLGGG